MLVDIVERFGRDAVAQVDLGVREHRNRPLDELGAAVARDHRDRVATRRISCTSTSAAFVELLRYDLAGNLEAEQVEVRERPPIMTIAAYRACHAR